MKESVQRFGYFLSGMVMPNITVFIAWGFITVLFIPTGWMPNETLAQMVASMQRFLLPTLTAYTGGEMVYDVRGDVVGAAAAIGIPAGTEDPMFIGVMTASPLGGRPMKKVDGLLAGRIPVGFETLVNSFPAGIPGVPLAVFGCLATEPLCIGIKDVLVICVDFLVKRNLLPLMSLFVESVKILFLNSAISHGVFTPLGMDQVTGAGKSIFFLIEANPGPGLGLLFAYSFSGKGAARSNAPNAVIIHFFGDIHEIYFPYVLMSPLTILAVTAGGMSGVFINSIFNSGLASATSPGSIIITLGMYARDGYIDVILSVIVVAVVSSVIAASISKFSNKNTDDNALEEASATVGSTKSEAKGTKPAGTVSRIVFACDAGMGSSAMGITTLTEKLNAVRMKVTVEYSALDDVLKDTQVIITYKSLVERAETRCPNALIFPITNFMGGKEYDEIVAQLTK